MVKAYPYPRRMAEGFNDEQEYADWLAQTLRRFGWSAYREYRSADREARADIVAAHDVWGVIGVECKFSDRTRPRDWAQAYKQARRYEGKMFRGKEVTNWAVAVAQNEGIADTSRDERFDQRTKDSGYREFLNVLDCGVLSHGTRLEFVFNNSNPMTKPPIAEVEHPTGELKSPPLRRLRKCKTDEALEYLDAQEDTQA